MILLDCSIYCCNCCHRLAEPFRIMAKYKICSRDDCPPDAIKSDRQTNCGKCNQLIHLKCYGINATISELLSHENMRLFCNACHEQNKPAIKITTKSTKTTPTTPRQRQITDFASNNSNIENKLNKIIAYIEGSKLDQIIPMLSDMKLNVNDVTNVVKTNNETAKSYASVLTEIKENTNEIKKKKLVRQLVPTKVNETKTMNLGQDFPSIDSRTPKRKRLNEPIETPKRKFRDRILHCGTNENTDNNLGSPVKLTRPKKISPFSHMTKSIYVSRLKNDVTVDKITAYIESKISNVKLEDFALNMLVKKDQAIDQFSFISFRLRCTPEYYVTFKDSSFWPKHVMIGEFYEQKRKPQFGDFIDATKTDNNTNENQTETELMEVEATTTSKNVNPTEEQTIRN